MSVPPESVIPPPPDNPPPSGEPPLGGAPSAEQRQWAMFGHLSALLGLVTAGWLCFLGPLVIWLVKKDTMPFAADQAKEALNFNITVMIAAAISWILMFVLIGILLLGVLAVAWLVFTIIAAIKANEGVAYRYPFTLRLIK
ncbi:orotate phosphoribosyltransferase [Rhodanobacter sp. Root480]|jgi:uncharacterized Tic20 family protein|uniref:DUF4870 domain-containing protein n=1 Tax=Rhodanobacter ginsenosidimutans TaxID=490571 RepID=A0ABW0JWW1_9GAMM|nr:orotate phosphoribosyltransferase [Rhodanobacter sp. Root480]KRA34979.1 orotate phosphoribosyltransferase [Rhodanobacter sp. Root627]